MAHFDIEDGLFIEYETAMISGLKKCLNAQIDFTGYDVPQMREAADKLDSLGLDDNDSLICHINNQIHLGNI